MDEPRVNLGLIYVSLSPPFGYRATFQGIREL